MFITGLQHMIVSQDWKVDNMDLAVIMPEMKQNN